MATITGWDWTGRQTRGTTATRRRIETGLHLNLTRLPNASFTSPTDGPIERATL